MEYEKDYKENGMEHEENDYVPLNWDSLIQNPAVFEEIKKHLNMLEAECFMAIITAAKEQNLSDSEIFSPLVPVIEVGYEELSETDPFEDSTED